MIITDNIQEAIPNIPVSVHNCLIRNGCANYEKFADMTDYDLAMLKYDANIKEMICFRNKARYYRDFQQRKAKENEHNCERQIPKKPTEVKGVYDILKPICPACGSDLLGEYCDECGQAIDWS